MMVRLLCPDPRVPTTLLCDWPLESGDVLRIDGRRFCVESREVIVEMRPEGPATATWEVRIEEV